MQTRLADFIRHTPAGAEAEAILRRCVHCGICTATCPTYQLLGDERDGPRGRIYLIKQMLAGEPVTAKTRLHLDRCLTCLACETACPSGVQYGRLLDIGREVMEGRLARGKLDRARRLALRRVLPYPQRFAALLGLARWLKPWLPAALARTILGPCPVLAWPAPRHPRKMLVLEGCVQPALNPRINAAAAIVLDRLGISLIRAPQAGCCGALSHHLGASAEGLGFMRQNIRAWLPLLDQGVEAIVTTASGCGLMVKHYAEAFKHEPGHAELAGRISAACLDLAEVLAREDLTALPTPPTRKIAFHAPCTLQHGQQLPGLTESILRRLGFELVPVANPHLCCGSAGAYSLLQTAIANPLRQDKLAALLAANPDYIATANIGCLTHLQAATDTPVCHWVELLV